MGGYGAAMRAYATFQGRASRAEFWQFTLVVFAINLVAYVLLGPGPGRSAWPTLLFLLIVLVHAVPYFAALARRLHDLDATGWWALIGLIPFVGLVLLIPAALPGTQGPNRFGGDPLSSAGHSRTVSHRELGPQRVEPPLARDQQADGRGDVVAQLEKLAQLRASGSLSDAEFDAMKTRLFAQERKA